MGQSVPMIGQLADPEAGEQSEGAVEQGNQGASYKFTEESSRDSEFRDEPRGCWIDAASDSRGENVDFFGCEAVEKEVGSDQVVMGGGGLPGAGICEVGSHPVWISIGGQDELVEHRRAGVNRIDLECWILGEEPGGEAAIAITENECLAG